MRKQAKRETSGSILLGPLALLALALDQPGAQYVRLEASHCGMWGAICCAPAAARPTEWPMRHNQDVGKSRTPGVLPGKSELRPSRVQEKDIEWAARQGVRDRKAGTECRKYKTFLITYELHKSDASLRLWNAYQYQTKPERFNTPALDPKRRSHGPRGLNVTGRATPRRKSVRKYDRENPRESELPPEIAALLMKLNQQNTLVDMWR
jgi:hypothetical protein